MSAAPVPTSRMVVVAASPPAVERRDRPLAEPRPAGEAVQAGQVAEVARRARARRRAVRRGAPGRRSADPRREGSRSPRFRPRRSAVLGVILVACPRPRHRIVVAGESLIDRIVRPDGGVEEVPGGGPFTTARALARLGFPVSFVGGLSTDASGGAVACRAGRGRRGPLARGHDRRADAPGRRGARRRRRRDLPVRAGGIGGGEPSTGGSRRRPATGHRRPPRRHARARPRAGRRDDRGPGRNRAAGRPRRRRPEHPAVGDRRRRRLPGAPGEGSRPRRRRPGEPRRPRLARAGSIDPRRRRPGS